MLTAYNCSYLPGNLSPEYGYKLLRFENWGEQVELRVPVLSPANIEDIYSAVSYASQLVMKHRSTDDIIAALDQTARRWADPAYHLRIAAEQLLPVITGYDREMIRLFIHRYMRCFRKEQLLRMVEESFPNPTVLDSFRPKRTGGLTRAYGPGMVTHIFSGNVPLLPLWSLVSSLLVKSGTLGKVSSSEPLFPVLFAESLREVDVELAQCLAIVWWQGGDESLEHAAFARSDTVIAYGHDRTIAQIQSRLPAHVRFHPHGHKLSFGVIAREAVSTTMARQTAQRAANDASWFDQQGCLSPHVFFVEEHGRISPRDFARLLAAEMGNMQHKLPRRQLSSEEEAMQAQTRARYEFQAFQQEDTEVHHDRQHPSWTVIYMESADFPISVLDRFVYVVPVKEAAEICERTQQMRKHLQTAGIACSPERYEELALLLGSCGVNRICFLGSMFQPESGWHHDGRLHLGDLVRWCDVESSVEQMMDSYDPQRE